MEVTLYNFIKDSFQTNFQFEAEDIEKKQLFGLNLVNIAIVFYSFIFHYTLFFISGFLSKIVFPRVYGTQKRDIKANWDSRVVSTVHAIIAFIIGGKALYLSDAFDTSLALNRSLSLDILLNISLGYFIYDLTLIFIFKSSLFDIPTFIHHNIAIASCLVVFAFNSSSYAVGFFMFTEVTTPFINLRWFLYISDMKNSSLYVLNGLIMFIGWFIVRIYLQYSMAYHFITDVYFNNFDLIEAGMKYVFIPLLLPSACCLNTFWFYKIANGFLSAVFPKKKTN